MVKFNGKQFKIYELDTTESIIERLAGSMNTIPKYIYFEDRVPTLEEYHSDKNIQFIDILDIVKTTTKVLELKSLLADKIEQQSLDMVLDVYIPFFTMSDVIATFPVGYEGTAIEAMAAELIENNHVSDNDLDTARILSELKQTQKHYQNQINANKTKVADNLVMHREYGAIDILAKHTTFNIERLQFTMKLFTDVEDLSLLDLFNHILLTEHIPYASIGKFYKVFKGHVPDPSWNITLDDGIVMKMIYDQQKKQYFDIIVQRSGKHFEIQVSMDFYDKTIIEETNNHILEIFVRFNKLTIGDPQETKVGGSYYYPNATMNNSILLHMLLNNRVFSYLMSTDESENASKSVIHVKFRNNNILVNATVIEYTVNKLTPKKLIGPDLKMNSKYVRVFIKSAENIQVVNKFQTIFSKCMTLYNNNKGGIINFYSKYLPTFAKKSEVVIAIKSGKTLTKQLPEIFANNYSSICPTNRCPVIVPPDKIEQAKQDNMQLMNFPIDKPGQPERTYACPNKSYPFPGLISNNTLRNKEEYPLLPCCFTKDRRKTPDYVKYYQGIDVQNESIIYQDIYKSDVIIPNETTGNKLPDNVKKIFSILELDTNKSYIRKGVVRTTSSLLNCILNSQNIDNILQVGNDELPNFIQKYRKSLSSVINATLCKQEMFDYSVDEIRQYIYDTDKYMDPSLFTSMLEQIFECNIYIFSRLSAGDKGEIILPRHSQGYYKFDRKLPSIFILEHIGSKSDNAEYPQCELIGRLDSIANEASYIFDYDEPIADKIRDLNDMKRASYSLTKENTLTNWDDKIKVIAQMIDTNGKCRLIQVRHENKVISIATDPMPIFGAIEIGEEEIVRVNIATAVQFIQYSQFNILGQIEENGEVVEINGYIGNTNMSILIIPAVYQDIELLSISPKIPVSKQTSKLIKYNISRKIARTLTEFFIWAYSKYVDMNPSAGDQTQIFPEKQLEKSIVKFVDNSVVINKNVIYTLSENKFNSSNSIMKNGKIIVSSLENLKRLVYILRLEITRNPLKVVNYKNKEIIDNYYKEISDFDEYPSQVILTGEHAIYNWIEENLDKNILQDHIMIYIIDGETNNDVIIHNFKQLEEYMFFIPESGKPYFFKNVLISEDIMLAQNTNSLESAKSIAKYWTIYNINPGGDYTGDSDINYYLYEYKDPSDITTSVVSTNSIEPDGHIVTYSIDGVDQYTVLLPFK